MISKSSRQFPSPTDDFRVRHTISESYRPFPSPTDKFRVRRMISKSYWRIPSPKYMYDFQVLQTISDSYRWFPSPKYDFRILQTISESGIRFLSPTVEPNSESDVLFPSPIQGSIEHIGILAIRPGIWSGLIRTSSIPVCSLMPRPRLSDCGSQAVVWGGD